MEQQDWFIWFSWVIPTVITWLLIRGYKEREKILEEKLVNLQYMLGPEIYSTFVRSGLEVVFPVTLTWIFYGMTLLLLRPIQ